MKKRGAFILVLVIAGLFTFGLWQLFRLRFEAGDVYAPYSSLRADPLGTMALYEALERMPGISVMRDFKTDGQLPDGRDTVYLHLSAERWQWRSMPTDVAKEIERFLTNGGRLALFFRGETATERMPREPDPKAETETSPKPAKEPRKKKARKIKREPEEVVSVSQRWGLELGFIPLLPAADETYQPARVVRRADLALPETLDWHSGLILTNCGAAWTPIYVRGRHPVVAERKFGAGSILVATDTYYLSNEALRSERRPEFLAWMVGPARRVIFDEAHLGTTEQPGIAALVRKYRLHGVVLGLAILAGLFIWQNAFSFVPLQPDASKSGYVAGKEAAFGFVNLLRRNIRPRELLALCLSEWKKHLPAGDARSQARAAEAEALMKTQAAGSAPETLVRGYREMSRILNPPKR